jgi:hypothetical protein
VLAAAEVEVASLVLTLELRQTGLLAELVVSMRQGAAGLAVRGRGLLEARRSVLLDTVAVEARVETMTTDIVVLLAAHQGVAVVVVLAGLA